MLKSVCPLELLELKLDSYYNLVFLQIPLRSNQNHLPKKHNIYTRDLKNFDRENFILDILGTNWNNTIIQDNADLSFNQLLDKLNVIIDKYMPVRKLSNKEFKRVYKPWITNGIVNSISRKNKLYNKYTKTTDNAQKIIYFEEYKILQKAFDTVNHKILLDKLNYYRFTCIGDTFPVLNKKIIFSMKSAENVMNT